ncbi:hypothetical protein [Butyrivibrio sp. NC2002]|uniref:hypothetical protein n=1 Tax=Butyrivibrio sp. NC2002 TaxID=1410610 RepID=UPI000567CA33|nr:hypothetical protein [Butyrivibrio sp. NC2002]
MKKKVIIRLLSLGLVTVMCTALAACGSAGTNADDTTTVVSEETASEEENADEQASEDGADNDKEETTSDMPEGEAPDGEAPEGEAPGNPPDGEAPDGEAPGNPPDGEAPSGEAPGNPPGGGFGGGSSSEDIDYKGSEEITSSDSQSDQTYSSTTADESALLISTSDEVSITNPTVSKTGDSDGGDNCNFYGLNAAVLVKDGSTTTITGGSVTSDADGANGVFSYGGNGGQNGASGDGTKVVISDTKITTTGDGSGGIMTTGGGITEAYNLTVETSGRSSAAIRTDRGGGTVTVDGGSYTTNGLGSPAIYSTADITVSNATLTSNLSEGVCIEGINSITLNDCDMTANNTDTNGNATFYDTIMIYQSMSGDADSGTSTFTMNGGSLTSKNGHVFHVTNTSAVINLSDVSITNEDDENILLSVCADGWTGDTNKATVNADDQKLEGTILVGSDSELTLNLTNGSEFTGTIDGNITNAKGESVSTEVGTVSVSIDENSTWTLTADTYITSFEGDASSINTNGYTLYVNGEAM